MNNERVAIKVQAALQRVFVIVFNDLQGPPLIRRGSTRHDSCIAYDTQINFMLFFFLERRVPNCEYSPADSAPS
jgi:hypothetical protein